MDRNRDDGGGQRRGRPRRGIGGLTDRRQFIA